MFTYWFLAATSENQTGPSFQFRQVSLTMTCGLNSIVPDDRFLLDGRILLRFTGPGTDDTPLLSSWTSVLCPFSPIFLLFIFTSCSPDGSSLAWEGPCKLDLENLLLLAASTRVFNGFQSSTFPLMCSPRIWSLEDLVEELWKNQENWCINIIQITDLKHQ